MGTTFNSLAELMTEFSATTYQELADHFYEDADCGCRLTIRGEKGITVWLPIGYRHGDDHRFRIAEAADLDFPFSLGDLDHVRDNMQTMFEAVYNLRSIDPSDLHALTELALGLDAAAAVELDPVGRRNTPPMMSTDFLLRVLMDAAREHGLQGPTEAGATHEVGDLQMILSAAWARLSMKDKAALFADFAVELSDYIVEPGDTTYYLEPSEVLRD